MNRPQSSSSSVEKDLLHFYDEFVEFHGHCSFLCDACASLSREHEGLDESTAIGLRLYCQWTKERMEHLKKELKGVRVALALATKRIKSNNSCF